MSKEGEQIEIAALRLITGDFKADTKRMYFNYHAKAEKRIREGHLVRYEYVERWNAVAPALVLFFDNAPPMPIREYRWEQYRPLLAEYAKDKRQE